MSEVSKQQPPTSEDVQAINELVAQWLTTVSRQDLEQMLTFITEDAVFLAPNAPPLRGKQAFAAMYREVFSTYDLDQTISYEEITVLGDWAFAWGRDVVTLTPKTGGEPVRFTGYGMTILRRETDGRWSFARGINNLTQESKAATAPHS